MFRSGYDYYEEEQGPQPYYHCPVCTFPRQECPPLPYQELVALDMPDDDADFIYFCPQCKYPLYQLQQRWYHQVEFYPMPLPEGMQHYAPNPGAGRPQQQYPVDDGRYDYYQEEAQPELEPYPEGVHWENPTMQAGAWTPVPAGSPRQQQWNSPSPPTGANRTRDTAGRRQSFRDGGGYSHGPTRASMRSPSARARRGGGRYTGLARAQTSPLSPESFKKPPSPQSGSLHRPTFASNVSPPARRAPSQSGGGYQSRGGYTGLARAQTSPLSPESFKQPSSPQSGSLYRPGWANNAWNSPQNRSEKRSPTSPQTSRLYGPTRATSFANPSQARTGYQGGASLFARPSPHSPASSSQRRVSFAPGQPPQGSMYTSRRGGRASGGQYRDRETQTWNTNPYAHQYPDNRTYPQDYGRRPVQSNGQYSNGSSETESASSSDTSSDTSATQTTYDSHANYANYGQKNFTASYRQPPTQSQARGYSQHPYGHTFPMQVDTSGYPPNQRDNVLRSQQQSQQSQPHQQPSRDNQQNQQNTAGYGQSFFGLGYTSTIDGSTNKPTQQDTVPRNQQSQQPYQQQNRTEQQQTPGYGQSQMFGQGFNATIHTSIRDKFAQWDNVPRNQQSQQSLAPQQLQGQHQQMQQNPPPQKQNPNQGQQSTMSQARVQNNQPNAAVSSKYENNRDPQQSYPQPGYSQASYPQPGNPPQSYPQPGNPPQSNPFQQANPQSDNRPKGGGKPRTTDDSTQTYLG